MKRSEANKEDQEAQKEDQNIEIHFQDLILSVKDRVRLANNRKEITDAMRIQSTAEASSYNVDLEGLLNENTSALDTNLEQTEGLAKTLKSLKNVSDDSYSTENKENLNYYNTKKVELKKQNTDLKEYLCRIQSKYSDDTEIQSLEAQKEHLKTMIAQKTKEHSDVQTNIHIVDSEMRKVRKKAAGTVNSLVIHFQADILQQMKEKIDQLKEDQVRRSQLQQIRTLNEEKNKETPMKENKDMRNSKCLSVRKIEPESSQVEEENPFEVYQEENNGTESPKQRKESTPLKLKGSFLEHEVKADIEEEEIEILQGEKQKFQVELQKVKEREIIAQIEKKKLQKELLQMQRTKQEEEEQFQKDTVELENLRKMREQIQEDYEQQVVLQNEIDAEIEAERQRKEEIQDLADKHILSSYLGEMNIDQEYPKEGDNSKGSICSRPSQDKSDSEEYSSFINDIRTVYELQDEETLTQNDVETVIVKPTPVPESEDSNESFEREGDNSVGLQERSSFEELDGLEKTLSNLCPQFPINYVTKPLKRSPMKADTFIEKNVSINNLNESFLRLRMSSIHRSGKSFGSKCYSQKVSPKMSPKAHTLRLDNSDYGSFCSQSPNENMKRTQKEIMIENLNSYTSKSGDSTREKEDYLITSPVNELKITYLSDKFKDSDGESRKIAKQKNFSEVNLLAPSLINVYPQNRFSPTSSRKQAVKMYESLKQIKKVSNKHIEMNSFKGPKMAEGREKKS